MKAKGTQAREAGADELFLAGPKKKATKLTPYEARLEEWFRADVTLKDAQELLRRDGCSVSLGRLSEWWSGRQRELQEESLIKQLRTGSKVCRSIEAEFSANPAPQLKTIIGLMKTLILTLSSQASCDPKLLKLVVAMLKPVMEHYKETGKQEDRSLARQKYQRETCGLFIKWVENEEAKTIALGSGDNSAKIEQLGKLMFGEDWEEKSES